MTKMKMFVFLVTKPIPSAYIQDSSFVFEFCTFLKCYFFDDHLDGVKYLR